MEPKKLIRIIGGSKNGDKAIFLSIDISFNIFIEGNPSATAGFEDALTIYYRSKTRLSLYLRYITEDLLKCKITNLVTIKCEI